MRLLTMIPLLFLAFAAAVTAQNPAYTPDPNWRAPAKAAQQRNPLATKPEAAAGGRKLFLRNCAQCHGRNAEGLNQAADLKLPVVQQQSDGTLFWKITNGNAARGMPSWSSLPEKQRWQLVLYLRNLEAEPRE